MVISAGFVAPKTASTVTSGLVTTTSSGRVDSSTLTTYGPSLSTWTFHLPVSPVVTSSALPAASVTVSLTSGSRLPPSSAVRSVPAMQALSGPGRHSVSTALAEPAEISSTKGVSNNARTSPAAPLPTGRSATTCRDMSRLLHPEPRSGSGAVYGPTDLRGTHRRHRVP